MHPPFESCTCNGSGIEVRERVIAFVSLVGFQGLAGRAVPDESSVEDTSFPVQRGDSLSITDDFGRILVRSSEGTDLEIKAREIAPDPTGKEGSALSVTNAFSGTQGEAVDFERTAPSYMNMEISGTNPEVDITGIRGSVRVRNSAGRITVKDPASSVSHSTANADITHRSSLPGRTDLERRCLNASRSC